MNGTLRDLFPADALYTSIDLRAGPGVDVVADAATYGEPDAYDLVLCTEVLEHATEPGAIVANAYRVLKPGGVLVLTTAWMGRAPHSCIDGGALWPGEWYANIHETELVRWLAPFAEWRMETDASARDIRCVAWKAGA